MSQAEFETALTAEGWDQQEMDDLRAAINDLIALGDIHRQAKLGFASAVSRWNAGVSAKVGTLGGGFNIPNPTDLAGTGDITKENLSNNLMAYATTVNGLGTAGHLDNILPLVGSVNV